MPEMGKKGSMELLLAHPRIGGSNMREGMVSRAGKVALVWVLWYSILPLYAAPPWLYVEGNKIKDPSGNVVVLRGISLPDLGVLQVGGALGIPGTAYLSRA